MSGRVHRITVFDYGAGNLHSLTKALASPNLDVRVETKAQALTDTDMLVLPGVGAFSPAVEKFGDARPKIREALRQGLPCIGICLGMQLLFDTSDEGSGEGLGIIPGRVTMIRATRVPHIGWNTIAIQDPGFLKTGGKNAASTTAATSSFRDVYYAHSYVCRPNDEGCVIAWTELEGDRFPAIVRSGRTIGVQFHPEKSSAAGVEWLRRTITEVMS